MEAEDQKADDFSVHYRQGALASQLMFGIGFAALMGWFAWESWHRPIKTIANFVGIIGGPPFFVFCVLLVFGALRLLFQKTPALRVTHDGLTYVPLLGSTKRLYWSEVGSFAIREQPAYRNKPQTFLDVFPHGAKSKPILSIHTEHFDRPISTVMILLEPFTVAHRNGSAEIPVEDTRQPARSASGFQSIAYSVLGFLLFVGVSAGSRVACQQANQAVVQQQRGSYVDREMARLDQYFAENAMFQAIKRVEPDEYEAFRQMVRSGITSGTTQQELNAKSSEFANQFMQKRMKYASAATLKQYVQYRIGFYEGVASVSPEALYSILMSGKVDLDRMPAEVRQSVLTNQNQFFEKFANIIAAPLSDTPLPQDEAMVEQRILAISERLSDVEREAFANEGKPDVDQETYSQAYLHLCREVLKLPEAEAVQVFRSLGQLPEDDRPAQ